MTSRAESNTNRIAKRSDTYLCQHDRLIDVLEHLGLPTSYDGYSVCIIGTDIRFEFNRNTSKFLRVKC